MRKQLKDRRTFSLGENDREKNGMPSKTVPDGTLSLKEILRRFVVDDSVLESQRVASGNFGDEDNFDGVDVEKLRHADLSEQDEFKRSVKDRIASFEEGVKKHDRIVAKRKAKAAAEAAKVTGEPQKDPKV